MIGCDSKVPIFYLIINIRAGTPTPKIKLDNETK